MIPYFLIAGAKSFQKGQRIYLYKLLKNVVKEDCKSMEEMLMALTGKITNISANFIAKAEG